MDNRFDKLAKELSRGRALKFLGAGALTLIIPNVAEARRRRRHRRKNHHSQPVNPVAVRAICGPFAAVCDLGDTCWQREGNMTLFLCDPAANGTCLPEGHNCFFDKRPCCSGLTCIGPYPFTPPVQGQFFCG